MNPSFWKIEIVFTAINSASVVICLLAAILVFSFKLHNRVVYRLALYQVLVSLLFSLAESLQINFIHYEQAPAVYKHLCIAMGWFILYTRWGKLLFTACIVIHLFCFAVLQKNLKKFEIVYVLTSLSVPAVIAIVPLTTETYGLSPIYSYCYIYSSTASNQTLLIERVALWDAPAIFVLFVVSLAMIALVIKIAQLLLRRRKLRYAVTEDDQFWRALKELLPLSAYPVFSFVFMVPALVFHIHLMQRSTPETGLLALNLICISLWGVASGVTLILHLAVTRCGDVKRKALAKIRNENAIKHTSRTYDGAKYVTDKVGDEISYTQFHVVDSLVED